MLGEAGQEMRPGGSHKHPFMVTGSPDAPSSSPMISEALLLSLLRQQTRFKERKGQIE